MDWQTTISLGVVAIAVWTVGREIKKTLTLDGGCQSSGCGGCPSNQGEAGARQLVSLETFTPKK